MDARKSVILVGGNGLIGKALARALAGDGWAVFVASRTAPDSTDVGPEVVHVPVDATSPDQVASMIGTVREAAGRIDAVVTMVLPRNAGYGRRFEDVLYSDFQENLGDHVGAYFLVCQKMAEYFTAVGGGNIINLASVYGTMAPRFDLYEGTAMTKEIEYTLSKAAVVQLTRYLARYLKGRNIRVNCVSPGGVYDNHDPEFVRRYTAHCLDKGLLEPDDIVGTIKFLLSDHSRHISGQNIVVDDGFSL